MKKKLLSVLLVAAMTVSVLGCGADDSKTDQQVGKDNSEKTQVASDKQEDIKVEEIDPEAAYEETVTISVPMLLHTDVKYQGSDGPEDNPWTRAIKDRYNIELDAYFTSENVDYATKINLAIAENNLPDVFMVNRSQLEQLKEADALYDITDVWDIYASDSIKEVIAEDQSTYESACVDGRMVAIPQLGYGYVTQFYYFWIRQDWKEELSLKDPENMEDVVDITKAFMENYGAGGIGTTSDLFTLKIIAPAWGAYPNIWVEGEDGLVEYGSVQPEMKEALAAWAQWYEEGIINADFATTDHAKLHQDTLNGEVGIYPYYQSWGWTPGVGMLDANGAEAIYMPYVIPSAIGEDVLCPMGVDNSGYLVISKDCENPEAVIKMLNFRQYVFNGSFQTDDPELYSELALKNGMDHYFDYMSIQDQRGERLAYEYVTGALETGDEESLTYGDTITRYQQIKAFMDGDVTTENIGRALQYYAFDIAFGLMDEGKSIKDASWGMPTETGTQSGSTLNDILTEGFTKIIMGEEPIDYFDDLVENWKAAGGDQMTIEMNEALGR